MAYIESHQELGRHPKTKRAARILGVSRPAVVGHLNYLWWWALDFAQDGILSEYDADEIADGALWDGDAQAFVSGLVASGFVDDVDGQLIIHDWSQYTGRLMEQRKSNAKRQQAWRDRNKAPDGSGGIRNGDVTVTSALRNGANVPYPTVPNRTPSAEGEVMEQSEDDIFVAAAAAPPDSASASPVMIGPAAADEKSVGQHKAPALKPVFTEDSPPMELAQYLAAGIRSHKPDAKIPRDLQGWAREFDLMLRIDKRPRDAIATVIDFATRDTFWRRVVFSADKLRQKFDTLDCQAHEPERQEGRSNGKVSGQSNGNRRTHAGGSRDAAKPEVGTPEYYDAARRRMAQRAAETEGVREQFARFRAGLGRAVASSASSVSSSG